MRVGGNKVILRKGQPPKVQKRPGKLFVEIGGGLELGLRFCRVVGVEISQAEVIVGRDELGIRGNRFLEMDDDFLGTCAPQ